MMYILYVLFFLVIAGVIYYGFAKLVIIAILIGLGIFVFSALIYAIVSEIRKPKPEQNRTENLTAEAGDSELRELRKMVKLPDKRKD